MAESAAVLARTIAAVAGPHARPPEDQVRAVEGLLEHRRRVLVAQATGWGKSAAKVAPQAVGLTWFGRQPAAAKRFGALAFQNASIRGGYAHDGR